MSASGSRVSGQSSDSASLFAYIELAYPGQHVDNGPEAFDVQAEFLARHLG